MTLEQAGIRLVTMEAEMELQGVTEGRILDLLTGAAHRFKREGSRGIDWTLMHMTDRERVAFDLFLVRVKDPLAWEAGTFEYRFRTRAQRMAEGGRA